MNYVSTRGSAPVLDFGEVLLAGLATDGGLYLPQRWPTLTDAQLAGIAELPYAPAAAEIMWPYVEGTYERDEFEAVVAAAYSGFEHPDVAPLRRLDDDLWLLELFWGPTLAFKDLALQLVGQLFERELARRRTHVTIVGATSGDTGSAAIEACRDRDGIEIFVLHPAGRVSEVQRRQMTTVQSANVHNIAIDGTFDDCQDLVKGLFADTALREQLRLSAVNSINWARVMAQIVYYVTSSVHLTGRTGSNPRGGDVAPVSFTVPTGNFGNVFAGYAASRMGAPVGDLVIASNRNDILTRFLATGEMEITEVHPTLSPSMDIQVSSNLERLLFELHGRDGAAIAELMTQFRAEGKVAMGADRLASLRERYRAGRLDDEATLSTIRDVHERTGMLIDPHTAVAVGVAREVDRRDGPMVCLATAHPAKFPDAVEQATGVRPPLPDRLADLLTRPERYEHLPNDIDAVRDALRAAT